MYLINIQYYMIIIDCNSVTWEIVPSRKPMSNWFSMLQFPMLPFHAVNIYILRYQIMNKTNFKKSLVVLERRLFKFHSCFSLCGNYLPLETEGFVPNFIKLAQWLWRRFLKIPSMYFRYFEIYSLKKGRAHHQNKLNPLKPRKLCAKFG